VTDHSLAGYADCGWIIRFGVLAGVPGAGIQAVLAMSAGSTAAGAAPGPLKVVADLLETALHVSVHSIILFVKRAD
jgi:hypothetical protein